VIEDKGKSWTDEYFREDILTQNVFPFFNNKESVIDPDEVVFVHDKTPCMKANMTQHLFQDNDVQFWTNGIWPRNSPDLNMAEHIRSIIKDEVEKQVLSEAGNNRCLEATLKTYIEDVLTNMEEDTELFETLFCSYPYRLRAVQHADGRHISY
jgi:hypothetical protein